MPPNVGYPHPSDVFRILCILNHQHATYVYHLNICKVHTLNIAVMTEYGCIVFAMYSDSIIICKKGSISK